MVYGFWHDTYLRFCLVTTGLFQILTTRVLILESQGDVRPRKSIPGHILGLKLFAHVLSISKLKLTMFHLEYGQDAWPEFNVSVNYSNRGRPKDNYRGS